MPGEGAVCAIYICGVTVVMGVLMKGEGYKELESQPSGHRQALVKVKITMRELVVAVDWSEVVRCSCLLVRCPSLNGGRDVTAVISCCMGLDLNVKALVCMKLSRIRLFGLALYSQGLAPAVTLEVHLADTLHICTPAQKTFSKERLPGLSLCCRW
jgi:hypothetical protein